MGCVAQLTNEKFMLGYKLVTLKFQRSVAILTQISIFTNNYAEIYSKAFFYLQLDSTVTQLAIAGNFIGRSGIKVITDMLKENGTITNVVS